MLRTLLALAVFIVLTVLLIIALMALRVLRLPGRGAVSSAYSKIICAVLGVRIAVRGRLSARFPVLVLANHVSWLDILVIAASAPAVFVAKREVARWPLVGLAAKARGTVFVDRERRQRSDDANRAIAAQLAAGSAVVLFAEGTSNDGNRVLPFRSALLGAMQSAGMGQLQVQPLSIAYLRVHGVPMGRRHRPLAAWYGDMDLMPHLLDLLRRGPIDVLLTWGDAVAARPEISRKVFARSMEQAVRSMTAAALRGRV